MIHCAHPTQPATRSAGNHRRESSRHLGPRGRNVAPDERPEDLVELNPYDSILTLVDRELVLYEPQIIMEYLDERFPHPPLMPVDPVARASNRLYRYHIQRDIYDLAYEIERATDGADAARKALRDNLTAIAPIFGQRPFFMSEDYSLRWTVSDGRGLSRLRIWLKRRCRRPCRE